MLGLSGGGALALHLGPDAVGVIPAIQRSGGDDEAFHLGGGVVGLGPEVAAEGGFGVELEHRHVIAAVILHQDGPIIGDQLGKEREAVKEEGSSHSDQKARRLALKLRQRRWLRSKAPSRAPFEVDPGIDEDIHQVGQDTDHQPDQPEGEERAEDHRIVTFDR